MLSTGPLFLSIQWKEYIWSKPARGQEVSVFFPDWFDEVEQTRFFSSFGGSSWHKYDVAFIFWVFPLPSPFSGCSLNEQIPALRTLLIGVG